MGLCLRLQWGKWATMEIRREQPQDRAEVRWVNQRAFAQQTKRTQNHAFVFSVSTGGRVNRFLIWASVLLSLAVPARAAEPSGPFVPARDGTELHERLARILQENHVPGMAVAIASRDGIVWAAGIGLADVAAGKPATATTLFRVASVSKIFVALAVLKLVEEGKVGLDTTVKSLAPEIAFANPWEATDPVRVAHLLEHTTGWDDIHPKEAAHNDPKPVTLGEALAFGPESRTSRWRPGTRYSYSNAGSAVAAAIVEKLTGRRFEDYVRETFFAPLGMSTADYFHSAQARALLTTLYRADGKTPYAYQHLLLWPSGALNASAEDMGHALHFLLRRGQSDRGPILGEASIQRMETARTSYGAMGGLKVGYGLGNYASYDDRMHIWHGHNGAIDGALSEFHYLPEPGVGYFFSLNAGQAKAGWQIENELAAYLTKNLRAPTVPPVASVPRDVADAYRGWYLPANPRFQILAFQDPLLGLVQVIFYKTGLVIHPRFGRPFGLYAVDSTHFRFEKSSEANLVVMDTPDGRIAVMGSALYRKITALQAWATMLGAILVLLAAISVPLVACIRGILWLARRRRGAPMLHLRVLPLLAWLALVTALLLAREAQILHNDAVMRFGRATLWSVALWVSTWVFAIASPAALVACVRAWKRRKEMNAFAYYHSLAVTSLFVLATVYFAWFGVIGYRSWA